LLLSSGKKKINLTKFSQTLAKHSSLQHIWFQVIDVKGMSLYRSWTNKSGDSLLKARLDVVKMIQYPHVISSISTGKFDMTFKSMVPLFKDHEFIGIIEVIAKFNSIAKKMQEEACQTLILVDKKYKKQLTKVPKDRFLKEYYIVNINPNQDLLKRVSLASLEKLINIKTYEIDMKNNTLVSLYKQPDIHGNDMGYFILSKKISMIDMSDVSRSKNKIIMALIVVFIFIVILVYYLYIVNYQTFIKQQNKKLESKVVQKTSQLHYRAYHDSLTGLANRLLFQDRLVQSIKQAERAKKNIALFFLDLDRFKEVNDTYGHGLGDELLIEITKLLTNTFRKEDTIARLGGDEFAVIVNNIEKKDIVEVVNKTIALIQDDITINGHNLNVTFSIGISMYPKDALTAEALLKNADTAMYRVKESGKNSYMFYDNEMTQLIEDRLHLKNDIKRALIENEFEPYFQVKIDARTNKVVGVEALVRWNHPEKDLILPDDFIPFTEEVGLISQIDKYMMKASIKIINEWYKKGLNPGLLSLNITSKQLDDERYMHEIIEIVESLSFDYNHLEIEILEHQIIDNPQKVVSILQEVKKLGITISIDGFGTGYSSLSYLKILPIDKLKIDRSFIMNIVNNKDNIAIVKTIINLAKNLDLDLVAEGVETQEQIDFLLQEGCYVMQGYFYSKPIPAKECEVYLQEHL